MMKIGVIGIGDISKKAYLPILTAREGIDLILCTRSRATLEAMKAKYKAVECVESIDDLLAKGINGAIVNAATSAHYRIVKQLLEEGIPVLVDKPVSDHLDEVEALYKLAKEKNVYLSGGFNRRSSTWVAALEGEAAPHLVVHQKNRATLPGDLREFIYDDFIHVVDTVKHLLRGPVLSMAVKGLKKDGLLYSVTLVMETDQGQGIGIMNRYSGKNEERIEYMCPNKKIIIEDLNDCVVYEDKALIRPTPNGWDWVPVLTRRGFEAMIHNFLVHIRENPGENKDAYLDLETHRICEEIVKQLGE